MFSRVSSVVSLFDRCCPSAIARFVVSVWVYAVNAVFFSGFFPHVCKEVFERLPSFAKSNSHVSVVSGFGVCLATSVFHRKPRFKLRRLSASGRTSVSSHSDRRCLFSKTSATLNLFALKLSCIANVIVSAITLAKPNGNSSFCASLPLNNSKPSKTLAGKIAYGLCRSFRSQASTAFSATAFNRTSGRNRFFSATASAQPHCLSAFVFNTLNTRKTVECHACHVYLFHLFLLAVIIANRNGKAIRKVAFDG